MTECDATEIGLKARDAVRGAEILKGRKTVVRLVKI